MYSCPGCEKLVPEFEVRCAHCGSDLEPIAVLNELPDTQFNLALRAARSGDWGSAVRLLGAVLSIRAADVEAWLLLGTLYARRGLWEPARQCLQMVLLFQRSEPRAQRTLEQIELLRNQAAQEQAET